MHHISAGGRSSSLRESFTRPVAPMWLVEVELDGQRGRMWNFVHCFVCISLTANGSQLTRLLPIPPTVILLSCLWSRRIFPSPPGSRLTIFYRSASSALLQFVNHWLNFTFLRFHAFRYGKKTQILIFTRIKLTPSTLGYLPDHSGDERVQIPIPSADEA